MGMGFAAPIYPIPTPAREPPLRSVVQRAANDVCRNPRFNPLKGREQDRNALNRQIRLSPSRSTNND